MVDLLNTINLNNLYEYFITTNQKLYDFILDDPSTLAILNQNSKSLNKIYDGLDIMIMSFDTDFNIITDC